MSRVIFLDSLNYRHRCAQAAQAIEQTLALTSCAVVSTKFSTHSSVLLHLATRQAPAIPIIWVDTGYNSRATRAYARSLTQRLNLTLHTFSPLNHQITVPPALDDPDHAQFTEEVKLEPFRRALATLHADAWISSVRHYQSAHRKSLRVFDSGTPSVMKVSPLLHWSEPDIQRYIDEHDLPVGPVCYDPTKGEPMRECGLHTRLIA